MERSIQIATDAIDQANLSQNIAFDTHRELRALRARIIELEREKADLTIKNLEATYVANMAKLALRELGKSYKDELHTSTADVISFVLSILKDKNTLESFAKLRAFAREHEKNMHLHNADVIRYINALPDTQTVPHIHEWCNKIREYCSKANSGVSQESIWLCKDENGMDVCMDKFGNKLSQQLPALFPNTELYYKSDSDSDEDGINDTSTKWVGWQVTGIHEAVTSEFREWLETMPDSKQS